MQRRALFVLPLCAILPMQWTTRHSVSELRFGSPHPARHARALQACLGIPTRPVPLSGPALAHALNAGHLEAAMLDPPSFALAKVLMGPRLTVIEGFLVTRTTLSASLKADIAAALTA